MDRMFAKILKELDYPPVFLVSEEQFAKVEGVSIRGSYGIASVQYRIISVQSWLEGKAKENTLYHETFHILFPHKPHWWIERAAEKMAGGGGSGYWSDRFNKTPNDVPPRARILEMARKASKHMKR